MTQPIILVLAGGAANRFWPLRDKQLVKFGDQSLLERHMRQLQAVGCDRFVVVVRPDMAAEVQTAASHINAEVRIATQANPRGMGDAVLSAVDDLRSLGDAPIYVTQAHDVVEPRFHAGVLSAWADRESRVAGVVAAKRVES